MRLSTTCNDTFRSGPQGHPLATSCWDFSEDQFREALQTHAAYRGAGRTVWLRGPHYPGYAVLDTTDGCLALVAAQTAARLETACKCP